MTIGLSILAIIAGIFIIMSLIGVYLILFNKYINNSFTKLCKISAFALIFAVTFTAVAYIFSTLIWPVLEKILNYKIL